MPSTMRAARSPSSVRAAVLGNRSWAPSAHVKAITVSVRSIDIEELKTELQSKLAAASGIASTRDASELRRHIHDVARVSERRLVQQIVEFPAQLKVSALPNWELFVHGKVPV